MGFVMHLHEAIRCTTWAIGGLCVLVIWKSHAQDPILQGVINEGLRGFIKRINERPQDASKYCKFLCDNQAVKVGQIVACGIVAEYDK